MKWTGPSTLLAAVLLLAASGSLLAEEVVVVTTDASYRAGSPEQKAVVTWLHDHAEFVQGRMVGDPTTPGDVQVAHTRRVSDVSRQSPGSETPAPPPPQGSPGDEITVSMSPGDVMQSWTYRWVGSSGGGVWQLTAYEYKITTNPR